MTVTKLRAVTGGRAQPSATAIAMLETLLRRAQAGEFQQVIAITDNGGDVQIVQSGPVSVSDVAFGMGLWVTSKHIDVLQHIREKHVPEEDPNPTG